MTCGAGAGVSRSGAPVAIMDQPELSRHCIPWTPFKGKLEEAAVCLVSSAGVRLKTDTPYNTDGELSYRVIPATATGADLAYDDTHYDHSCADADINCIFPIDRLRELAAAQRIGGLSERHFSFGFTTKLKQLRDETLPKLLKEIESVRPDVVVLTGG
jgi:D-proline reductase (dithiol) PrdB